MRNTIKYFCAMILVIIILGNHSIVVANSIAENIKEKDNKTEESTSNTVNNIDEKTKLKKINELILSKDLDIMKSDEMLNLIKSIQQIIME